MSVLTRFIIQKDVSSYLLFSDTDISTTKINIISITQIKKPGNHARQINKKHYR